MKSFAKKLSFLVCTLALAFPVSASAANITTPTTVNSNSNYEKLSDKQLLSETGVTILLQQNEPLQVEYPDGHIETFTYRVEDTSNANVTKASGVTKRASVERGIMSASLELWGYATWEGRTVSFDDDVYLDYWGLSTSVEEDDTWVVKRSATNSGYAEARTRGTCTTIEPITGVEYYTSFDFEMWLDPINSSQTYIHINK